MNKASFQNASHRNDSLGITISRITNLKNKAHIHLTNPFVRKKTSFRVLRFSKNKKRMSVEIRSGERYVIIQYKRLVTRPLTIFLLLNYSMTNVLF